MKINEAVEIVKKVYPDVKIIQVDGPDGKCDWRLLLDRQPEQPRVLSASIWYLPYIKHKKFKVYFHDRQQYCESFERAMDFYFKEFDAILARRSL